MKIMLNIVQEDYAFGSTIDGFILSDVPTLEEATVFNFNKIDNFFDECLIKHDAETILLDEHKIDRFGERDEMRYSAFIGDREHHLLDISYDSVNKIPAIDVASDVEFAIINVDDNITCLDVKEDGKTILELKCNRDINGYIPPFMISLNEKKIFLPEKKGLKCKLSRGYKFFIKK